MSKALREEGMHNSAWSQYRRTIRKSEKDPLLIDSPHSKQARELAKSLTSYSAKGINARVPALIEEMRKTMGAPMRFSGITPNQALKDRARARLSALRAQAKPKLPPIGRSKILKLAGPKKRLP